MQHASYILRYTYFQNECSPRESVYGDLTDILESVSLKAQ